MNPADQILDLIASMERARTQRGIDTNEQLQIGALGKKLLEVLHEDMKRVPDDVEKVSPATMIMTLTEVLGFMILKYAKDEAGRRIVTFAAIMHLLIIADIPISEVKGPNK